MKQHSSQIWNELPKQFVLTNQMLDLLYKLQEIDYVLLFSQMERLISAKAKDATEHPPQFKISKKTVEFLYNMRNLSYYLCTEGELGGAPGENYDVFSCEQSLVSVEMKAHYKWAKLAFVKILKEAEEAELNNIKDTAFTRRQEIVNTLSSIINNMNLSLTGPKVKSYLHTKMDDPKSNLRIKQLLVSDNNAEFKLHLAFLNGLLSEVTTVFNNYIKEFENEHGDLDLDGYIDNAFLSKINAALERDGWVKMIKYKPHWQDRELTGFGKSKRVQKSEISALVAFSLIIKGNKWLFKKDKEFKSVRQRAKVFLKYYNYPRSAKIKDRKVGNSIRKVDDRIKSFYGADPTDNHREYFKFINDLKK